MVGIIHDLRARIRALEEETGVALFRPSVIPESVARGPAESIVVQNEEDRDLLNNAGRRPKHVMAIAMERARKAAQRAQLRKPKRINSPLGADRNRVDEIKAAMKGQRIDQEALLEKFRGARGLVDQEPRKAKKGRKGR